MDFAVIEVVIESLDCWEEMKVLCFMGKDEIGVWMKWGELSTHITLKGLVLLIPVIGLFFVSRIGLQNLGLRDLSP